MTYYPELETDLADADENLAIILEELADEGINNPRDYFERHFIGLFSCWADYAGSILAEMMPKDEEKFINWMRGYFDFGKFAADLSHDFIVIDLGRHQGIAVLHNA